MPGFLSAATRKPLTTKVAELRLRTTDRCELGTRQTRVGWILDLQAQALGRLNPGHRSRGLRKPWSGLWAAVERSAHWHGHHDMIDRGT